MKREKDYLLIYIKESYYDEDAFEDAFIVFFNTLFTIEFEQQFEIEKGAYALINKKSDHSNDIYYILASSNHNMGLMNSSLDIEFLTNLIFINDYDENTFIYVDCSKGN